MTFSFHFLKKYGMTAIACAAIWLALPTTAFVQDGPKQPAFSPVVKGADLDLSVKHYSRIVTPEGVLRESRYEEKMLRRTGHVWVSRVLPKAVLGDDHEREHDGRSDAKFESKGQSHKHFNYVMLPRHVIREGEKVRLEFVNFHDREVVSITPAEYENVNFDGSWSNAFFLMDLRSVAALHLSGRVSPVAGARWREQEKNGLFQRVLWDEKRLVPLIVETGDHAGRFFERVEVTPLAKLAEALPWQDTKGFAQKEYADFLD
jgi:hypothetical protein